MKQYKSEEMQKAYNLAGWRERFAMENGKIYSVHKSIFSLG